VLGTLCSLQWDKASTSLECAGADFAESPTPADIARPGMDFDSSLFDLPFEDLASLSVDTQQQQFTASAGPMVDFQDFCSDFATGDFASSDFPSGDFGTEVSDTTASSWNFDLLPAVSPTHVDVPAVRAPKDENSFKDGKDAFDTLGPCDGFQEMFNYNMGSEVQVVPDMTPGEANAAEFTLPTFSQSYVVPKSTTASQGLPTKPYSWMNGMDYASFGWPARTRLPSEYKSVFDLWPVRFIWWLLTTLSLLSQRMLLCASCVGTHSTERA
jgi:hypothetical protein